MKTYYTSLNCYPSSYPELSGKLLALLAKAPTEWFKPVVINPHFLDYGSVRTRNELKTYWRMDSFDTVPGKAIS